MRDSGHDGGALWLMTIYAGRRENVGRSHSQEEVGQDLNPSQPASGTAPREDKAPALWAPRSKPVSKAWTDSLFTRTLAGQAVSLFWSQFPYLFCGDDNPASSTCSCSLLSLHIILTSTSYLWNHCPIFPVRILGPEEAGWPVEGHTEGQQ